MGGSRWLSDWEYLVDFTDKTAIVTGAGKGIGRAIAEGLAARGASVVANNRSRDGIDSAGDVVSAIEQAGGCAVAERSSVEAPGASEAMVEAALSSVGRLDLVVANAAVVHRGRFVNAEIDHFRQVMEIDFMAPAALARAALPEIRARSGRMLFVTSAAGTYGEFGASSYAAAKGAVAAFAKTLALEHARDEVMVNLLAPFALTQMTEGFMTDEQAEMLRPELVVPAALWLLSDEVTVSGATVVAAGNRFRTVVTGETRGVAFPGLEVVADDDFVAAVGALSSEEGWKSFSDGSAAFTELVSSAAPSAHEPEVKPDVE